MFIFILDSDAGMIVTPKDIANSPLLEVVQVYGVNPEDIWRKNGHTGGCRMLI